MYKEFKFYIFIFLFICGTCFGCSDSSKVSVVKDDVTTQQAKQSKTKKVSHIVVFVCGEVKKPGVYKLDPEDRVVAAIEAAGGLTKKASIESVNQADKMKDGQQIYVPSKSKKNSENSGSDASGVSSDSGKVNLNSASKEELMTLTGIGEAKAEDIISYREEKGSFKKPEDIMQIQGIKEGVFSKIKDKITV